MSQNVMIKFRIDARSKQEFERITKRVGLSLSAALRTFIKKTIIKEGLPFEVRTRGRSQLEEQAMSVKEYIKYLESLTDEDTPYC